MSRCRIILEGIQIKSIDKARKLAKALDIIEIECGIENVEITLKNVFVCKWIDFSELRDTEMECLLRDLIK